MGINTRVEVPAFPDVPYRIAGQERVHRLPGLAVAMMDAEMDHAATERSVYSSLDSEDQDDLLQAASLLSRLREKHGASLEEAIAAGMLAFTILDPPKEVIDGQ